MKILHVITSLNNGGAENHLAELASLQAKQNNSSINIVYLRGSDYWAKILKKKKISIKKINIKNNYNLIALLIGVYKIFNYIRRTKPEIVHAHLSLSEIIITFLKLTSILNFKMIISKHLDSFLFEGSRGQNKYFNGVFFEKIIFKISDHVIFISKNVQLYFLSKIDIVAKKNSVIYYGIDKKKFIYQNFSKNKKQKVNIIKNKGEKLILNIARHVIQKKIDFLIKGFAEYLKIDKNSKLILVGYGDETKNLKLLVKKLKIENKIYWIDHTDFVFNLFKIADVFCLTSKYEGLGLVLLESMASKVPVITMNNSAMKEVVKNNFSGLLLSKNAKVKSLSVALNKILNNKNFRKKIIKNGLTTLNKKFSTKKMLESTTNVYKNI